MTLYICTAGTSIATGPAAGPTQAPLEQRVAAKRAALTQKHGADVLGFLYEISAETNGLARDDCGPGDTVLLLASDTDDGIACAEAVKSLVIEILGARARVFRVSGLTVKVEHGFRQQGIRNLIGIIHAETRAASERVVFNATGGFKGVVPYLTLMGMFLNVPVHYVFETSDAVIRLPPLPVRFDLDRLGFATEALRALKGAPGAQMREADFRRLLPAQGFGDDEVFRQLIEVSEGQAALSAAGELALTLIDKPGPSLDRLLVRKALLASPIMASEQIRYALPRLADPLFRQRASSRETFPHAPGILVCKPASGAAPRIYYQFEAGLDGAPGVVRVLELLAHKDHEDFSDKRLAIPFVRYAEAEYSEMNAEAAGDDMETRLAAFVEHVLGEESLGELVRERDAARAEAQVALERAAAAGRRLDSQEEARALVRKAALWAAEAFAGKTRKDSRKTPYINHLLQVVALLEEAGVREGVVLAAAWLHDAIEDVGATQSDLTELFGTDVARLVQELSDDKSLSKEERKRLQIANAQKKSARARLIKLADKTANLRDVANSPPSDWDLARRFGYFVWAQAVVNEFPAPASPPEERLRALFASAMALAPRL